MIIKQCLSILLVASCTPAFAGNISERRPGSSAPVVHCVVSVPVKKADSGKDAPIVCKAQTTPATKPEQARPRQQ